MKTVKRILSVIFAVATAAATAVTASAGTDTVTGNNGERDIDVKAKYSDGAITPDVYSVDIVWGAMEFTYLSSGKKEWNPATHKYTDNTVTGWNENGNTVTVTNHSNRAVNADFAYTKASGFDGVNGKFSIPSDTLDAGVENDAEGADSTETKLTLEGILPNSVTDFVKVGSITVSID